MSENAEGFLFLTIRHEACYGHLTSLCLFGAGCLIGQDKLGFSYYTEQAQGTSMRHIQADFYVTLTLFEGQDHRPHN